MAAAGPLPSDFFLDISSPGAGIGNTLPQLQSPLFDEVVFEDESVLLSLDGVFVDPDGDLLTYAASGLPTGLFLDTTSNSIVGTPTAHDLGSYLVVVTAFDGRGGTASNDFFLDVLSPGAVIGNSSPFLQAPLFDETAFENESFLLHLDGVFADPDGDQLSHAVSGLPTSLFLDPATNTIVGTLTDSDLGSYVIEVTAFDGRGGDAIDDFLLDVLSPTAGIGNSPPVLRFPLFDTSAFENDTVSVSLTGVFADPDGDQLSYEVSGLPNSLFLDDASNTIVGTPTEFDLGSYVIEVTAFDGRGGTAFDEFFLDVLSPTAGIGNSSPFLQTPLLDEVAIENESFSLPLDGVFSDPDDDPLNYAVTGLPTGLFLDPATNAIVGTPTEFDLGSYVIEVTAFDGRGGTAFEEFFLDVRSSAAAIGNNPPVLQSPLHDAVVFENEPVFEPLDGIFVDPDGDPLTYVVSGLPTSLFLDQDTNTVIGTPTAFDLGSYVVEVTAFDGQGGMAFEEFFLDVLPSEEGVGNTDPILQFPLRNEVIIENEPIFISLDGTFLDPDGDLLSYGVSGLPDSLFFNHETNSINGTPAATDVGLHSVTVTTSDGRGGTAFDDFFLDVVSAGGGPNTAPILLVPIADDSATEGIAHFQSIAGTFSDPDLDELSIALSGLPSGLFFEPSTDSIQGTPTAEDVGDHFVTATASDGRGGTISDDFILSVAGGNTPPTLVLPITPDPQSSSVDTPYNLSLLTYFSDPNPGDILTYTVSGAAWLTVDGSGNVSGTPTTADLSGSPYVVTVTATDLGALSVSDTFSVHVITGNLPPSAIDDNYSTPEDVPLSVTMATGVLLNDSDADGGTLLVTPAPVSGPANGSLTLNSDGSFTYTPSTSYIGPDSFVYEITDGQGGSTQATVNIAVTAPANVPPTVSNDFYDTDEDVPLTTAPATGVLLNDFDSDGGTLLVTPVPVSGPSHGSLTLNSDGSFTYTPDASYVGADSFIYNVTDGQGGSSQGTVDIMVETNLPPTAVDDNYNTSMDVPLAITMAAGVLQNDSDPEGDLLNVTTTPIAGPTNGSLTLNSDGSFTYTPFTAYVGPDSFTYEVTDEHGASDQGMVNIDVGGGGNIPPLAIDDDYDTPMDVPLNVTMATGLLQNDSDSDADPLIVTLTPITGPTNGSLTLNSDGSFDYTPFTAYVGPDSFTYEVTDGQGGSDQAIVNINVGGGGNMPPTAVNDDYNTPVDVPLNVPMATGVLLNDSDPDGDPLNVTVTPIVGPTYGSLTLNSDGSFDYTPFAAYSGPDSFTYEVTDGQGGSDHGMVNLIVGNVPPLVTHDSYNTIEDTLLTTTPATGVLLNDSDIDGGSLNVNPTPVSSPVNGSVTLNSDGSFTYTPSPTFTGLDSFDYEVTDGQGGSSIATAVIAVTGPGADVLTATGPVGMITPLLMNLTAADTLINQTTVKAISDSMDATLTNQGTVYIENSFSLTGDGVSHENALGAVINIDSAASFSISGTSSSFTNNGTIVLHGIPGVTSSTTILDSTVDSFTNSSSGIISGTGTWTLDNLTDNGSISIGSSPGLLTLDGDLTKGISSSLDVELAGSRAGIDYDQLVVTGTAKIGGKLNVSLLKDFLPSAGNNFLVLVAGVLTGSFGEANGLDVSDSIVLDMREVNDHVELVGVEVDQLGTAGHDVLIGTAGSQDVIVGGSGNDIIEGISGADILYGQDGNDVFAVATDFKRIDGGAGIDRVALPESVDYRTVEGVRIERIEVLDLNDADADSIELDADAIRTMVDGDNELTGINNSLVVLGNQGDVVRVFGEFLPNGFMNLDADGSGSQNFDVFTEGDVSVLIPKSIVLEVNRIDASLDVYGSAGNDAITGSDADDLLNGNAGNDILDGRFGADRLFGGSGDDVLIDDRADLSIDGGSGVDTLLFTGTLDLGNVDNLTGIEVIDMTGAGSDTLQLDLADIFALATDNGLDDLLSDGKVKLMVNGDEDDKVSLNGVGNLRAGNDISSGLIAQGITQGDLVTLQGEDYLPFTKADITLLISTDLYGSTLPEI